MKEISTFQAQQFLTIPGRGLVCLTELDRDTEDFDYLINKEVHINGERYICRGVELKGYWEYTHRKGESIGLLVRPIGKEDQV